MLGCGDVSNTDGELSTPIKKLSRPVSMELASAVAVYSGKEEPFENQEQGYRHSKEHKPSSPTRCLHVKYSARGNCEKSCNAKDEQLEKRAAVLG